MATHPTVQVARTATKLPVPTRRPAIFAAGWRAFEAGIARLDSPYLKPNPFGTPLLQWCAMGGRWADGWAARAQAETAAAITTVADPATLLPPRALLLRLASPALPGRA